MPEIKRTLAPNPSSGNRRTAGNGKPPPKLPLSRNDLENLRASGLQDETILANGLRTETDSKKLAKLLNRDQTAWVCSGGLLFPYGNLAGEDTGFARIRPHCPRERRGEPIKYEHPKGEPPRAYFPRASLDMLTDGESAVFLTEGEKKALALAQTGLAAVALGGVWSWKKKGAEELIDDLAAITWKGRVVFIVFDFDQQDTTRRNVDLAKRRLARALRQAGAREVYSVDLPPGPKGAKQGVDDFLVARGEAGPDAFGELIEQAQPVADPPRIQVSTREAEVNDEAVAALAADGSLYQRGGVLVHVVRSRRNEVQGSLRRSAGLPQIVTLPAALLRERLAANAEFFTSSPGEEKQSLAHPPGWCVQAVFARGQWAGIPHLEGVVDVPVLRPDGSVLHQPGYDAATGLLYLPSGPPPDIPDQPSGERVHEAVELLFDLVADFPFAEEVHRAAWLAYLLTPLARHAFDGPAPLTLIDSNVRGAGKGLLASLVSIITTGRDVSVTVQSSEDDEMRKAITSAVLAGDTLITLDNVTGGLGSPALDAALTSTNWRDRQLGHSRMIDLPLYAVWAATGNNVVLKGDLARRVLHVRLNSPEEHPEEREGFRHPHLKAYARERRTELLGAALTLLRGYCAAGRPDQGLSPWGSYEAWSALVRGALVWADVPDPAVTRDEVSRESDPEATALPALLAGLEFLDPDGKGMTVGQILEWCVTIGVPPEVGAMRDALSILCPGRGMEPVGSARSLGMKLHHLRNRVVGGKWLERPEETRAGAKWRVGGRKKAGDCGTSGTSGTTSERSNSGGGESNGNSAGAGSSPASPASPAGGGMGSASTAFYELLKARGQQRRQAGAKGN
jgi:hypothetical protein